MFFGSGQEWKTEWSQETKEINHFVSSYSWPHCISAWHEKFTTNQTHWRGWKCLSEVVYRATNTALKSMLLFTNEYSLTKFFLNFPQGPFLYWVDEITAEVLRKTVITLWNYVSFHTSLNWLLSSWVLILSLSVFKKFTWVGIKNQSGSIYEASNTCLHRSQPLLGRQNKEVHEVRASEKEMKIHKTVPLPNCTSCRP